MEYEVYRKGCVTCGENKDVFISLVDASSEDKAIIKAQEEWCYSKFGEAGAVSHEDVSLEEQFIGGSFHAKLKSLKTNKIVIEIDDYDDAYELFEEIQNKYSFYDNCVIETDVDLEDSIVDHDRTEEGPGLKDSHNKIRKELKT